MSATGQVSAHSLPKYDVFISYRHTLEDKKIAVWLHRAIETFRTPKRLVKQKGCPPRLNRVFRDEEEFSAGQDLSDAITQAVMSSKFFILICSEDTPSSKWINDEVELFRTAEDRTLEWSSGAVRFEFQEQRGSHGAGYYISRISRNGRKEARRAFGSEAGFWATTDGEYVFIPEAHSESNYDAYPSYSILFSTKSFSKVSGVHDRSSEITFNSSYTLLATYSRDEAYLRLYQRTGPQRFSPVQFPKSVLGDGGVVAQFVDDSNLLIWNSTNFINYNVRSQKINWSASAIDGTDLYLAHSRNMFAVYGERWGLQLYDLKSGIILRNYFPLLPMQEV